MESRQTGYTTVARIVITNEAQILELNAANRQLMAQVMPVSLYGEKYFDDKMHARDDFRRYNLYVRIRFSKDHYYATGAMTLDNTGMSRLGRADSVVDELRFLGYGVFPRVKPNDIIGEILLDHHLTRAQCQLPFLGHYNVDELREMVVGRGGAAPKHSTRLVRDGLMDWLRKADAAPTFSRFMDLPPELREQVYEHHFASFPEILAAPYQPPITMVSKQIRHESLPLFFSTCQFAFDHTFYFGNERLSRMPATEFFVRQTAGANLARIRKLAVRVSHGIRGMPDISDLTQLVILLEIDPSTGLITERDSEAQATRRGVYKGVSSVFKGVDEQWLETNVERIRTSLQRHTHPSLSIQGLDAVLWQLNEIVGHFDYQDWRRPRPSLVGPWRSTVPPSHN